MSDFVLAPADADKEFLLRTARGAVADGLAGREAHPAAPPPECSAVPQMELGAFVTLELDGVLRGCIGQLTGSGPLYVTVARMAQAAAFGDSRFAPLTAAEAGRVWSIPAARRGLLLMRGAVPAHRFSGSRPSSSADVFAAEAQALQQGPAHHVFLRSRLICPVFFLSLPPRREVRWITAACLFFLWFLHCAPHLPFRAGVPF